MGNEKQLANQPEGQEKALPEQKPGCVAACPAANPVIREHAPYFIGLSFVYGICFSIAFYRNFIGITYPAITAVTLAACWIFMKKCGIGWKKANWPYMGICLLLGISTILTTNWFVIFFNTVGILLVLTVLMLRQVYDDRGWGVGQYICNILFLYLCMIPELASPFIHIVDYQNAHKTKRKGNKNARNVLIGVLIGVPMLLVLTELLSSADQIFSSFIGSIFRNLWRQVIFSPNLFLVLFLVVLGFFGIYCFLSALTLNNMPEWKQKKVKRNPVTAITFLSMVTVLYLIFCVIQVVFLFTGGKLLPKGYTYARYARQGFFQLLVVCIFNFMLVIICLSIFQKNKWLKILLMAFSGCTYIMVASSAFRMFLYIGAYHLSFLRVLVLWFLAMLVFLMAGVMVAIAKEGFGLFRYCMAVVAVSYLVFSFGRVDYLIASYNLQQLGDKIGYEDVVYLANLSMDAAPALSKCRFGHEHSQETRGGSSYGGGAGHGFYDDGANQAGYAAGCRRCRLDLEFQEILDNTDGMDLRTFHISKYIARKAAQGYFAGYGNGTKKDLQESGYPLL